MPEIKCNYCEKTTTQGVGERSGFAHAKASIGKGKLKRTLNIYACSDHSDKMHIDLASFFIHKGEVSHG